MKSITQHILTIFLGIFILGSIILIFLKSRNKSYEGYEGYIYKKKKKKKKSKGSNDSSDENNTSKMDYVVINSGDRKSYKDRSSSGPLDICSNTIIGSKKIYCIFGEISCNQPGYDVSHNGQTDDYGNRRARCINAEGNGSHNLKCINSKFENKGSYTFYNLDTSNCIDTNNIFTLNSLQEDYGDLSGNNTLFKGFSTLMDNSRNVAPFVISDSNSYLTVKFGDNTDISYSTCFFYDTSNNCATQAGCDSNSPLPANSSDDSSSEVNVIELDTKCLGNFGDKAGDKLCCGSDGLIQSKHAKYTCPESHPYCRGFKCGKTWGKCYRIENED